MDPPTNNPLSPDSQAFMDLLERHLSEHDRTAPQSTDMSLFPGNGYTSFSAAGEKPQPAMTPTAGAPSPNTMAALINILQVQAQASGADPQTQQRQLVQLLNNMPWAPSSAPANNTQLDAFAQAMLQPQQTNVHPSQLYAQPANAYPYPGIDTPEHSGPGSSSALKHGTDSNGNTPPGTQSSAGSSPEAAIHNNATSSSARVPQTGKNVGKGGEEHVKRKAGDEEIEGHQSHRTRHGGGGGDSHDDDSEEDHEQTGKKTSKRTTTKASRRKSGGGIALDAIVTKGDEDLDAKALKRKNQNRAAQKAFRERREARVKDLEDKVNELEAKNAGNEFENENLRQLLAKLQQENVALKTAAFTFSMPMPQTAQSNPSPVGSASQSPPERRVSQQRLPPPPQPQPIQHRGESTSSSASGVSNTVRSSSGGSVTRSPTDHSASVSPFGARPTGVFNPEPFNAFASAPTAQVPAPRTVSPQEQQAASSRGSFTQFSNPAASGSSLMQRVQQASPQNMSTSAVVDPIQGGEMDWQSLLNNNFTMLASAPEFMSFSDDAAFGNFGGYSDIWPGFSNADLAPSNGMSGIQSTLGNPSPGNQFTTIHAKPTTGDDALLSMADDNMEEFLRSLGAGQTPAAGAGDEDVFDMNFGDGDFGGLAGLKNGSSSTLSSAPSMLSPNNFFTTSPDASSASSVSPLNPSTKLASASPASDASTNSQAFRVGTFGGPPTQAGPSVLQKDGTVVNCNKLFEQVTSRIPINSGFDLDDLCDHFKKKAVCNGKGPQIKEEEADRILAEYAAERKIKLLHQGSSSTSQSLQ